MEIARTLFKQDRLEDGVAELHNVVKVEPMASATVDEVIELAAPSIRATLRSR